MASAILLGIVTAVTSAIVAGQQNSLEAQQQISATLAADALMAHLMTVPHDQLATWHGFREEAGAMVDEDGSPMPVVYATIGREVSVQASTRTIKPPGVTMTGRLVTVTGFTNSGRVLITLQRFVPEPQ